MRDASCGSSSFGSSGGVSCRNCCAGRPGSYTELPQGGHGLRVRTCSSQRMPHRGSGHRISHRQAPHGQLIEEAAPERVWNRLQAGHGPVLARELLPRHLGLDAGVPHVRVQDDNRVRHHEHGLHAQLSHVAPVQHAPLRTRTAVRVRAGTCTDASEAISVSVSVGNAPFV